MKNKTSYYNKEIETMDRGDLDSLIDEKVKYTVKYAYENSKFYKKWFEKNKIDINSIQSHEDLKALPIISGDTIKKNQPPINNYFSFKSADDKDIITIHETSGTSGNPKSFFLTKDDWGKYIQKYARTYKSQGFKKGDSLIVCAAYGMNIGADSMSLAAKKLNITTIPEGKCTFPVRIIENYKPTSIVGSIFKFLRLAKRMKENGLNPEESSIKRLIAGGESFSEESRKYIEELWGVDVFNTYGSTEGTMCGECSEKNGIHVPEDLIHLDIYNTDIEEDPNMRIENEIVKTSNSYSSHPNSCFLKDGKEGKIILTTLLNKGEKAGTLLINYDTDDSSSVITREKCACGRTHMKINNPVRNTETANLFGISINRVDIEAGVFQKENMEYLTGEYESFIYGDEIQNTLRISLECKDLENTDKSLIENNFLKSFLENKKSLKEKYYSYYENELEILFNFCEKGELEFYKVKGRPKRVIDRR
ncbi:coenzyme F390 synthetase [Methanobrevibacter sp. TMH8]|uniref:coenzyme F390 synthetase n=1 Tax=Methanobrevibacter sp. TMH8 TaxID=2848611 RepID=UPI001CCE727E|nr:coenzyme F390 synthetase [Methanobrevibacter sp. TMH8]MBZ9570363.1 coenzyme F390 synthetase [Methanobrevibacter sp. TMH8]